MHVFFSLLYQQQSWFFNSQIYQLNWLRHNPVLYVAHLKLEQSNCWLNQQIINIVAMDFLNEVASVQLDHSNYHKTGNIISKLNISNYSIEYLMTQKRCHFELKLWTSLEAEKFSENRKWIFLFAKSMKSICVQFCYIFLLLVCMESISMWISSAILFSYFLLGQYFA